MTIFFWKFISAQRWRQIDQTSATKQKEKRERSGEEKGGERRGRWEVERNDISFLPSFRLPAAGEEKLADEARDERRAHHDGAPKVAESFLVFNANFFVYFFFR